MGKLGPMEGCGAILSGLSAATIRVASAKLKASEKPVRVAVAGRASLGCSDPLGRQWAFWEVAVSFVGVLWCEVRALWIGVA